MKMELVYTKNNLKVRKDDMKELVTVLTTWRQTILCVHDSFVVAKEHLELLVLTMADKFRERFKIDCPVPMSIKWKDTSKTGALWKDTDKSVLEKKIVL